MSHLPTILEIAYNYKKKILQKLKWVSIAISSSSIVWETSPPEGLQSNFPSFKVYLYQVGDSWLDNGQSRLYLLHTWRFTWQNVDATVYKWFTLWSLQDYNNYVYGKRKVIVFSWIHITKLILTACNLKLIKNLNYEMFNYM